MRSEYQSSGRKAPAPRDGYCHQRCGDGRGNRWNCERKAKVERDGQGYCTQHDPLKRAERAAAATAVRLAELEQKNAAFDRMARIGRACDAVVAAARVLATAIGNEAGTIEDVENAEEALVAAVRALEEAEGDSHAVR
jgi:hypothetical protein